MRIEYSNGPEDHLDHYLHQYPDTIDGIKEAVIKDAMFGAVILILAATILFMNEEAALGYILSGFAAIFIFRKVLSQKKIRSDFLAGFTNKIKPQDIVLELNDEGMTEYSSEVVSFVPWHRVNTVEKSESTYFIDLPANQWAIIPEEKIKSTEYKMDELIKFMKSKGVKIIPNKSVLTTPEAAPPSS